MKYQPQKSQKSWCEKISSSSWDSLQKPTSGYLLAFYGRETRRSRKRRSDQIVYHCAGFSMHCHFTVVSSLTSITTAALVFSATLHSVINAICGIPGLSSWPVIQTRGFQNAGDHRQRDGVSQFVTWQTEGHQQHSDQSKKKMCSAVKNELRPCFSSAPEREDSMWSVTPASLLTGFAPLLVGGLELLLFFSFQLLPLGLTTEDKIEWQVSLADVFTLNALPDTNFCTRAGGGNLFVPCWGCTVGVTDIELWVSDTHTDQQFLQCEDGGGRHPKFSSCFVQSHSNL